VKYADVAGELTESAIQKILDRVPSAPASQTITKTLTCPDKQITKWNDWEDREGDGTDSNSGHCYLAPPNTSV
jgi:hypothetical protein